MAKKFYLVILVLIALVFGMLWYFGWKDVQNCKITQNTEGYSYNGKNYPTKDAAIKACVPYAN